MDQKNFADLFYGAGIFFSFPVLKNKEPPCLLRILSLHQIRKGREKNGSENGNQGQRLSVVKGETPRSSTVVSFGSYAENPMERY